MILLCIRLSRTFFKSAQGVECHKLCQQRIAGTFLDGELSLHLKHVLWMHSQIDWCYRDVEIVDFALYCRRYVE